MGSQNVLNCLGVGDDRGLVVLSAPQVEVSIGAGFNLSASVVQPLVFNVFAVEGMA
jgi:hypothetical protein